MHEEIIFSGFGGQGALFAGQVMTYAGMEAGWEVTWIPSYGPEMRGGTAHCTVILSDQPIGSPIIRNPTVAVVLNPESMDKYEPLVRPGGLLVVNSTLIRRPAVRDDITAVHVPANELAVQASGAADGSAGNSKMANVVLLGAMLAQKPIVSLEAVEKVLEARLTGAKRRFIEPNKRALHVGAEWVLDRAVTRVAYSVGLW
ncbi:MAG: 2-oxoacid:acceptor oxidoreductase family protein [Anaerolineae bacterium]|nr:2-oxoacid:acceptor oxidoreductase family protein [Anaerolineae bacterium]